MEHDWSCSKIYNIFLIAGLKFTNFKLFDAFKPNIYIYIYIYIFFKSKKLQNNK